MLQKPLEVWHERTRAVCDYQQVPDDRAAARPPPLSAVPDTGTRLDCPGPVRPERGTTGSANCGGLFSELRCSQSCQWEAVPDSWHDASSPPIRSDRAPFPASNLLTIMPRPFAGLSPVRDGNRHSSPLNLTVSPEATDSLSERVAQQPIQMLPPAPFPVGLNWDPIRSYLRTFERGLPLIGPAPAKRTHIWTSV
jgi:hypothetical protein